MSPRSFLLDDALDAYVRDHTATPDLVVASLIDRTSALGPISGMSIGLDQAMFLTALTSFARVGSAVEVGTFTGMSSLAIARGLVPEGTLLCLDVNEEWTSIARRAWRDAGVADRVDLVLAPALDSLRGLAESEQFDLAFIDADKTGYVDYYEALVPRLRSGGVLLADNTLWSGRIVDDTTDDDVTALRRYNDRAAHDPRVRTTILTIGDGITLSQKV